jgi:hypothetical protein
VRWQSTSNIHAISTYRTHLTAAQVPPIRCGPVRPAVPRPGWGGRAASHPSVCAPGCS